MDSMLGIMVTQMDIRQNKLYRMARALAAKIECKALGIDAVELSLRRKDRISARKHFQRITHKGHHVYFEKGFCVYAGHQSIYLGSHIYLVDVLMNAGEETGTITVDDYVSFGHGVYLLARGHNYARLLDERHQDITEKPIHIMEGAWIGSRSTILGGVTVGKHSVVAACSVVT